MPRMTADTSADVGASEEARIRRALEVLIDEEVPANDATEDHSEDTS